MNRTTQIINSILSHNCLIALLNNRALPIGSRQWVRSCGEGLQPFPAAASIGLFTPNIPLCFFCNFVSFVVNPQPRMLGTLQLRYELKTENGKLKTAALTD
jgi:hypothetical protein